MLTEEQAADYVRRYDGVAATILTDGAGLVRRRVFWLAMFDGCAEPELILELFEGEDLAALDEEIRASGRWPVIPIGERFAQVVWHGHEFEGGTDYVVLTPGRAISVAAREGHGYGPGLSWAEFDRLATTPERLLLALPALGDADAPPEAVERVAAALITVGRDAPAAATEAARQILDNPARWSLDGDILLCDGAYTVRKRGGLPDADLRAVTAALAAG
ncbi:hypothetical protein GCM10010168_92570 [Actinoplanes ianthinogenes]|uniref:Uncharacterized protein n=1 Tax=Actinoplanes ianthinogenes TaxID=122358 RepID=A0ABN6C5G7_9ACTN|nr:hypothetical protein [Actinoplanes ianthinogenes]BCJ39564.1 hypothetical protein Aiant_02210 [Actinoplanes ianthinogenes]GGR59089.1 hypothetical protein GCM10010168_92570 [Actinoplanes ianthinogenes]